ncbi:phosphatase PAP2 family protein [Sphaerisporangium sp. TRM90804]|uniref:phosphatase PAP2 family protein n=1 Tax=Sphaerisporangium sp. TRM90804 TaxID=3031113 RepID=UPI00244CDD87|nr:phosphatase PAP2 family protein [Sphaerisporangium sp. TRM90804]MDH2428052.1 phosphatase PAP2 family protein [Sphaerisporangium sp. TRM90804]
MTARGTDRHERLAGVLRLILLPLVLLATATLSVGWLITRPLHGAVSQEAEVSREIAADRTPLLNTLTDLGSSLSDTPVIVVLTAIAAIVFRLVFKRWRESVFIVVAVWSQSLVFLLTTVFIERPRPEVHRLDPAPPTSSFPSGHTSAAVGFYVGMALVLTLHAHRHTVLKALLWTVGLAAPLIVASSRLYRGMHFLTDVTWGLILGAVCVAVAGHAILGTPLFPGGRRRLTGGAKARA